jgi:hypothetical protein
VRGEGLEPKPSQSARHRVPLLVFACAGRIDEIVDASPMRREDAVEHAEILPGLLEAETVVIGGSIDRLAELGDQAQV